MATITLHGDSINTNGELPAVGSQAPEFKLTDGELNDKSLADFAGKRDEIRVPVVSPVCVVDSDRSFHGVLLVRSYEIGSDCR